MLDRNRYFRLWLMISVSQRLTKYGFYVRPWIVSEPRLSATRSGNSGAR